MPKRIFIDLGDKTHEGYKRICKLEGRSLKDIIGELIFAYLEGKEKEISKEFPFKCSIEDCFYRGKTQQRLDQHFHLKHKNKCEICGQVFTDKNRTDESYWAVEEHKKKEHGVPKVKVTVYRGETNH